MIETSTIGSNISLEKERQNHWSKLNENFIPHTYLLFRCLLVVNSDFKRSRIILNKEFNMTLTAFLSHESLPTSDPQLTLISF